LCGYWGTRAKELNIDKPWIVARSKPPGKYIMGTLKGSKKAVHIVCVSAKASPRYAQIVDELLGLIQTRDLTKEEVVKKRDELIASP
jgi:hypothetical protein